MRYRPPTRLAAAADWHESKPVFTTKAGTEMDAANMRRDLRRVLALAPDLVPAEWTPRELRHSFVSVLPDAGVPLDAISTTRPVSTDSRRWRKRGECVTAAQKG